MRLTSILARGAFGLALAILLAACAAGERGPPRPTAGSACASDTAFVYFESGSAALNRPALRAVRALGRRFRPCPVVAVAVTGLADPPGDPQSNLALSEERARAVSEALARAGFPRERITVDALGEQGARRDGGAFEPMRRRVEIRILTAAR